MRLSNVEKRHRWPQKLMLGMIRLISGMRHLDVLRTLLYRPEFFGQPYSNWMQALMRGQSEWSIGQRELFAAFTSNLNQCRFCTGAHGAASSQALYDDQLVKTTLTDWRSAPLDSQTKAILGFLEKLTLEPSQVTPQDLTATRATGLSDTAIEEAIHICAQFNIINRLADSLGFQVLSPHDFIRSGQMVLRFGYKL
jgi:uncharacterized peroxidase-related enzyme